MLLVQSRLQKTKTLPMTNNLNLLICSLLEQLEVSYFAGLIVTSPFIDTFHNGLISLTFNLNTACFFLLGVTLTLTTITTLAPSLFKSVPQISSTQILLLLVLIIFSFNSVESTYTYSLLSVMTFYPADFMKDEKEAHHHDLWEIFFVLSQANIYIFKYATNGEFDYKNFYSLNDIRGIRYMPKHGDVYQFDLSPFTVDKRQALLDAYQEAMEVLEVDNNIRLEEILECKRGLMHLLTLK